MTAALVMAGLGLALALAVLMAALLRPRKFRVEGRLRIDAPAGRVYDDLQDFRRWPSWSAWAARAPGMRLRPAGAATGRGAVCAWSDDGRNGAGTMEIVHVQPPRVLVIRVTYAKPREMEAVAEFELRPLDGGGSTELAWAFHGPATLRLRVLHVLRLLDWQVRSEMSRNLAGLRAGLLGPGDVPADGA